MVCSMTNGAGIADVKAGVSRNTVQKCTRLIDRAVVESMLYDGKLEKVIGGEAVIVAIDEAKLGKRM